MLILPRGVGGGVPVRAAVGKEISLYRIIIAVDVNAQIRIGIAVAPAGFCRELLIVVAQSAVGEFIRMAAHVGAGQAVGAKQCWFNHIIIVALGRGATRCQVGCMAKEKDVLFAVVPGPSDHILYIGDLGRVNFLNHHVTLPVLVVACVAPHEKGIGENEDRVAVREGIDQIAVFAGRVGRPGFAAVGEISEPKVILPVGLLAFP